MDAERESSKILRDKESLKGIAIVLSEDPTRITQTAALIKNNAAIERYAHLQQADRNVIAAANSIPVRDRVNMQKRYKNAGATRSTTGAKIISLRPNGYAKEEFYPLKEKLEGLEKMMFTDELGCFYNAQPDRTNKLASVIIGTDVRGTVLFFKIAISQEGTESIVSFTKKDFESLYPQKVVWK